MITIKEYAERHGMSHDNVRHKCQRGGFKTAKKVGRDWLINEKEAVVDHRITTGAYVGVKKGGSKPERDSAAE